MTTETPKGLVKYKDGYRDLLIDSRIEFQVKDLDIKIQNLNNKYNKIKSKQKEIGEAMDIKHNERRNKRLKPYRDRMTVLNDKMTLLEAQKTGMIQRLCKHKFRTRWTGGDYNEHLITECLYCDFVTDREY